MLSCPKCKAEQPLASLQSQKPITCHQCGSQLMAQLFPALLAQEEVARADALMEEDEASCFYHPQKKAVTACDFCGRFVCALCDLDLGHQHLCPTCHARGKEANKVVDLIEGHKMYDSICLSLAVLPLFFWPATILTAPTAIYYAVRHYRKPLSLVPRWRWRYYVGGLLGLAQLGGWASLGYFIYLN